MTRKELIAATVEHLNEKVIAPGQKVSNATVERILGGVFDHVIPGALEKGEAVSINDFGKLEPKIRKARKGRNPQTGAEIEIGEKKTVKFRLASALKARLGAADDDDETTTE